MTQLVLEINNNTDLQVLLHVLEKFGVKIKQKQTILLNEEEKDQQLSVIDEDASSIRHFIGKKTSLPNKKTKKLKRLYSFIEEKAITVDKIEIPSRDERNQR